MKYLCYPCFSRQRPHFGTSCSRTDDSSSKLVELNPPQEAHYVVPPIEIRPPLSDKYLAIKIMNARNPLKLVALGIAAILTNLAWAQTTDNWTSTSSALWGTAGNWSTGVPTNTGIATFNSSSGLDTSISLLPSSTANSLVFS